MLEILFQNDSIADFLITLGIATSVASIPVFVLGLIIDFVPDTPDGTLITGLGVSLIIGGMLLIISGTRVGQYSQST